MKKKSDLIIELAKFYKTYAEKTVFEYEKERKTIAGPNKVIKFCALGVFICFVAIFLTFGLLIDILGPIILILFVILIIYGNKYGSKMNSNKNLQHGDYELELKKKLMPKFLEIFDCGLEWTKYIDSDKAAIVFNSKGNPTMPASEYSKFISNTPFKTAQMRLQQLEIYEDKLFKGFDDIIVANNCAVPVEIAETAFGLNMEHISAHVDDLKDSKFLDFKIQTIGSIIFVFPFVVFICAFTISLWFLLLFLLLPIIVPILIFKGYKKTVSDSHGVILKFNLNKRIKGHVVIFEKNHIFNSKHKYLKYSKVTVEDNVYENKYDTYSTDQVEARYLLTTSFLERFDNIKTSFNAKSIRAEACEKELFLIIKTDKDLFQMGEINKETCFNTFSTMLDEIYSVLSLSEQLNLDSKTGL